MTIKNPFFPLPVLKAFVRFVESPSPSILSSLRYIVTEPRSEKEDRDNLHAHDQNAAFFPSKNEKRKTYIA